MILEHVAIYTSRLEVLRAFYEQYFGGVAGPKYVNPHTRFESYFLRFDTGARLELMQKPGIPQNANDPAEAQHTGLIHLAFGVPTTADVDALARTMQADGIPILRGPRRTGDGYYEFETLDPDNNRIEVTAIA
ncbi:MAG: VOC family protein [Chitinophagaceae bacterium]|jgi:lactoylglutathione lyase|nr:VOC family protein [Chitinophagaceae bacterium]